MDPSSVLLIMQCIAPDDNLSFTAQTKPATSKAMSSILIQHLPHVLLSSFTLTSWFYTCPYIYYFFYRFIDFFSIITVHQFPTLSTCQIVRGTSQAESKRDRGLLACVVPSRITVASPESLRLPKCRTATEQHREMTGVAI